MKPSTTHRERAFLLHAYQGTLESARSELDELAGLTTSAGGAVVGEFLQRRRHGEHGLGDGKLRETAEAVTAVRAEVVITQQSLTPLSLKRLEDALPCRVVDRTTLILDVFAQRARSREGQLQVELAQLMYRLPRLRGKGVELSRQAGAGGGRSRGLGTQGPGEQKLEYDRRRIRDRMAKLRRELESLRGRRARLRDRRHDADWPLVALAGYTNAGKSTLFNALTRAGAMAEQRMFSTLDPQVRRIRLPGGGRALLTDTVGFIRDLPEGLRVAFRATLEEIGEADAVLHVVDASHPEAPAQAEAVRTELRELGLDPDRVVTVLNKTDLVSGGAAAARLAGLASGRVVAVSAKSGEGVRETAAAIEELLRERYWKRMAWATPAPGLRARLAALGASSRESGDGTGPLEAWLAPAAAARLAAAERG